MTETRFKISVPRFQRSPVDTYLFSLMIKMTIPANRMKYVPLIDKIKSIIIKETGCDPFYETGVQKREYVTSRYLFAYFVKKYCKLSQRAIGLMIGNKNHSTIAYGKNSVQKFVEVEPEYAKRYNKIETEILKHINP